MIPRVNRARVTGYALATGFLLLTAGAGWWRFQQAQARRVPILMYHRIGNEGEDIWWVRVEDFEAHLRFLREQGYRSILPSDLVAHRRWGKPLPPKPIVLTFDDGYLNSLQNAEPLLKKYGFRGIVYLVTGKIADDARDRQAMEGTPLLTWPEVRAMRRRGTLTFGGHTRSHANLAALPDPYPEIRGCYTDIRRKGGFRPDAFCYPNGEYRPETLRAVRRAGFTTAVTCHADFVETGCPIPFLELPRASVYGGRHTYHVEVLPRTDGADTSVRLKVWKDGVAAPSLPRLAAAGMTRKEGWLPQAEISGEPRALTWRLSPSAFRGPVVLELWGDLRILPHYRQELTLPAR